MSSLNRRKNNNRNNGKNNSNSMLGSFTKDFPELSKMAGKVNKNFVSVSNNKYFLYVMLFLGISTVLGFMSVKNYNAVILFLVVTFAMRYFTKNIGIMMLVAVLLSNIISVKSTIEGMQSKEGYKDADSEIESGSDSDLADSAKVAQRPKKKRKTKTKSAAMSKILNNVNSEDKNGEGMAPIDYKMSKTSEVDDDEDMIDLQSTQQAAYENLNKIIGDKGFSKMTQDTQKLMSQQENLAKAMESIGPLLQNAEKMMEGLNLDKFTGMLDKLNGMVGGTPQVKAASN